MGDSNLQLTITTCPQNHEGADKGQQDEETGIRWHVQVRRGDESTGRSFELSDPFDAQQNAECRWYLDRFVQRSPYSVTRAAKGAEALDRYARSIIEQLHLLDFIEEAVRNDPLRHLTVDLSIEECDNDDATIHRLHWELLENPTLWQPLDVQITVIRISSADPVPREIDETNKRVASLQAVNLLLVVARDLSSGVDQYEDVDPSLATKILTNIQDKTRVKGQPVRFNVEIVRPSTRSALEQHLKRTQEKHGPGYFDLVHFDLHGEVNRTEQQAYLLFNSDDGSLQRESAQEVAEVLKRHCISCVVLNACESARADCGKDANIAQVLHDNGVSTVLAMSHQFSSTAAEVFLTAFYHSMLLNRLTLANAAREGRAALRRVPERDARFGLRRSLLDYLVPVAYLSRSDLSEQGDETVRDSRPMPDLINKPKTGHLIGRGFDLLRLEKLLQARRCVFISGPAGIGKTALLLEARKLWLKTRFVEIVCVVNFSSAKFSGFGEFAASMVAQLPLKESEKHDLTDRMNEVVSKPAFEMSELASVFLKEVRGHRCMFIFDGLHIAYARWEDKVLGFPGRARMDQINQFIGALIKLTREDEYQENTYLVFAGRLAKVPVRLEPFVPLQFDDISFPLTGLQMSDFMLLAQTILRKHGYPDEEWTNSELNELELTLDLLQGIPGAAWQILPVVASANISRNRLRTFVHQGLCEATPTLQEHGFYKQLLRFSELIKDGLFASLLILSLFWQEGPQMAHFSNLVACSGLCEDDDALSLTLSLAYDQGYFMFTSDFESTIIHPLFTIYGRMIANSIFQTAIAKVQNPSHSWIGRASQWVSSLVKPATEKQELAAIFVKAIWEDDLRGTPESVSGSIEAFRDVFLELIATRSMSRWVSGHCKGTSFGEVLSRWNGDVANLQTCISICLRTPPLPIEKWPLQFFQQQASGVRMYGTTAQASLCAVELGRVLQNFIELNGGYALRPEHQFFGLSMSSCLAALYNSELRIPPKFEYYVQCGLDLISKSEATYGPFTDFNAIYTKGLIMRYKALHLLETGSQAEAEELWQSMLDLEESLWNGDNSKSVAFPEEITNALVANFSTDSKDADTVRKHVQAMAGRSVAQAYYKSRKQSLQLIKLLGERRRRGQEYEKSKEYKAVLMQAGLGMEQTLNAFENSGLQDLDSDKRWWPENMDMLKHVRRYKNSRNRLDDLEEAQGSGNVFAAAEHHQALLRDAITSMDLEETGEHADALERIYQQDPAFEEQLQGIRQSKTMFSSLKLLLKAGQSGSNDKGKGFLDAFASHQEVFARAGVSQEAVEALGINMQILAKDQEMYGDESAASMGIGDDMQQMMMKGMRSLMANIGDPEFVQEFSQVGLKMMKLLQEIQDAEASHDSSAELAALHKYEEFSRLPIAQYMVDQAWIERRRKEINRKIIWKPYLDKWTKAIAALDFEAARTCVENMANDQPDTWNSEWASEKLLELHQETHRTHWNTVYANAMAMFHQAEFKKAAVELDELTRLHDDGKFCHLEPQVLVGAFYGVKTNQLLCHINLAMHASDWQRVLDLCDEWFTFTKERSEEEIQAQRDGFLDLKEASELQVHSAGYSKAVQELRTGDAMTHLMALYALSERQSQMPHLERKLATLVSKEMLTQWQQKLLLQRLAQSFRSLTAEGSDDDDGVGEAVKADDITGKQQEEGKNPDDSTEQDEDEIIVERAFREAAQRAWDAKTANIINTAAEDREG